MRGQLVLGAVLALAACDVVYGLEGRDASKDSPLDAADGDLVAHFPMDMIGSTLVDTSGYGHVGFCQSTCPTPIDGKVGGALHFDGTGGVGVNADDALETTGAFTIAGWYRIPASMPNPASCPFNKVYMGASNSWQLCFSTDRRARFYTTTDGVNDVILESDTILAVGAYHHVALWWDGTTKRIYLNGIEGPEADHATVFDRGVVGIGADYDDGSLVAQFTGDLDDLRIYRRALSTTELVALVQLGN